MVATTRRKTTIGDYLPHGGSRPWRVMTWDELEYLYDATLTESQNLGEVIVAIQIGDMKRALDACQALIDGAKP